MKTTPGRERPKPDNSIYDVATRNVSVEPKESRCVGDRFSGAPLDFVKVIAAGLMVMDHVNYVFLGHTANILWYLGRAAFPLFAFAIACNLLRGTREWAYTQKLILLGIVSQPLYATLMASDEGDILFTLSASAVLIVGLRTRPIAVQHFVFFVAVAAIFSSLFRVRAGVDYGIAGMLFPVVLYFVLEGRRSHLIWLTLLLFALNWYPIDDPWVLKPIRVACFTGGVSIIVVVASLILRTRRRFLPRYALHIFYPGHLLVLMIIHYWL